MRVRRGGKGRLFLKENQGAIFSKEIWVMG